MSLQDLDVAPLQKVRTGIDGFDEITFGGLPKGRPTLLVVNVGSRKTMMAMKFIVRGARDYDEPGVFVAFEETPRDFAENFASRDWDLKALQERAGWLGYQAQPIVAGGIQLDKDAENALEKALQERGRERYVLRLYVAGTMPRSARAVANIKRICEEELQGRYDLEVVDMYQQPQAVNGDQIFAVPTLIKRLPAPLRRVIGDMSDEQKVLVGLGITPKDK